MISQRVTHKHSLVDFFQSYMFSVNNWENYKYLTTLRHPTMAA